MIKLINLTKKYDRKIVLDNFSAELGIGAHCITGASGSGKTTLLHVILGIVKPDSGEVVFADAENDFEQPSFDKPSFAAVFQEDRLCENISAVKNVCLVCPKKFPKETIIAELTAAGLGDSLYKPAATLSGGMKRRVCIVRGLITNADIIIMDEPLKGLDSELKTEIVSYIKEKVKDKIFIFVTHDKTEAELLGARLYEFTSQRLRSLDCPSGLPVSG